MTKRLLFISYAHKDEEWLDVVIPHLTDLSVEDRLSIWSDVEGIEAGDNWKEKIDQALERADVAVLLLSADFLASKFIRKVELPHLFKRKEAGDIKRIIPIVVRRCKWESLGEIEEIQVRPKGALPLSSFKDLDERDGVLSEIGQEIQRYVESYGEAHTERAVSDEETDAEGPELPPANRPLDWETLRPYAVLELRLRQLDIGLYNAELQFSQSEGDDYNERTPPYPVRLDFTELDKRKETIADYQRYLEDLLFRDPGTYPLLKMARERANSNRVPLRFRVRLYPNSRELHRVQWELLCSEDPNHPLYLRESAFSRDLCAFGQRWQQVRVRRKSERVKLMLGIAAPDRPRQSVHEEEVSPIDADVEAAAFSNTLSLPMLAPVAIEKQLGLDGLSNRLSEGYDILILVSRVHVRDTGEVLLELADANGDAELVDCKSLMQRLETVPVLPRLLVLSPPLGGGRPQWKALESCLRMAPCFQQTGIPAVVGLQRPITGNYWDRFLAELLGRLAKTGRMDAAVSAARAELQGMMSGRPCCYPVCAPAVSGMNPVFWTVAKGRTPGTTSWTVSRTDAARPSLVPELAVRYCGHAGRSPWNWPMSSIIRWVSMNGSILSRWLSILRQTGARENCVVPMRNVYAATF